MGYLGLLALLAILFFTDAIDVRDSIGTIPVAVPWFGAVGGVLLSLKGVFDHPRDWDPGYRLWHLSRPLVASALGVIAVLMFQSGILAVGSDVEPDGPGRATNLFYYLIAFLVGYREETFRSLIERLVDVFLGPGGVGRAAPVIGGLEPSSGSTSGDTPVTITGSGFMGTRSVKFGGTDARFNVHNDNRLVATAPESEGPGPVSVTVTGPGGSATDSFTYTGATAAPPPPP